MQTMIFAILVVLGSWSLSHASSLLLVWNPPTTGPAPDGYRLERRVPPAPTWEERWRGPGQQHVETVDVAQEYCWRVRSLLLDVVSDPSAELCRTMPAEPEHLRVLITIELMEGPRPQ